MIQLEERDKFAEEKAVIFYRHIYIYLYTYMYIYIHIAVYIVPRFSFVLYFT